MYEILAINCNQRGVYLEIANSPSYKKSCERAPKGGCFQTFLKLSELFSQLPAAY